MWAVPSFQPSWLQTFVLTTPMKGMSKAIEELELQRWRVGICFLPFTS